jgi:hypothetical protein
MQLTFYFVSSAECTSNVGQLQTEKDMAATSHGLISDTIVAICLE